MSNKILKLAVFPAGLVLVLGMLFAMHTMSTQALQPDAFTIEKSVESETCSSVMVGTLEVPMCMAGDVVTYTIVMRTDMAASVTMTDPLPMYTDPFYFDDEGEIVFPSGGTIGTGTVSAGTYMWQGNMPDSSAVTLTLAIQVSAGAPAGASLENTAYAMGQSDSAGENLVVWAPLYLPAVFKNFGTP